MKFLKNTVSDQKKFNHNLLELINLINSDNLEFARDKCANLIDANPKNAKLNHLMAVIYHKMGELKVALDYFNKSLECNPKNSPCLSDMAVINLSLSANADKFSRNEYLNEALILINKAILIDSKSSLAYINKGKIQIELGDYSGAIVTLERVIRFDPSNYIAYNNISSALIKINQPELALECANKAVSLNPNSVDAHHNQGAAFLELLKLKEAAEAFRMAIAVDPKHYGSFWNLSIALLLSGNYEEGFKFYEYRKYLQKNNIRIADESKSLWLGDRLLEGKRIYIYWEQGFGDTLQFVRYVPLLEKIGAYVILEVQRELFPLLKSMKGIAKIICDGDSVPEYDYYCPLMSLPLSFRTDFESVPFSGGYLESDLEKKNYWRKVLSLNHDKLKIGIAWSGNPNHARDKLRSICFKDVESIFEENSHINFYVLQKGLQEEEKAEISKYSNIILCDELINDFSDTAALCSEMDAVISVDTSLVHLAGSLGVKTFVLLAFHPDWRWMVGREDSPWYKSATLVRQDESKNWTIPLKRIAVELKKMNAKLPTLASSS